VHRILTIIDHFQHQAISRDLSAGFSRRLIKKATLNLNNFLTRQIDKRKAQRAHLM